MMASTTAYPPSVILPNSSKPITLSDAQQQIAEYLTRSETNPHLHPDALIQASGPTFSVQGGPQGGLVLHQLRRVEAGLRGEILKPDPRPQEKESDDTNLDGLIADTESQITSQEVTPAKRKGGLKRRAEPVETDSLQGFAGSQGVVDDGDDLEQIAQNPLDSDGEVNMAEGADIGELGTRSNVVEDGGEIPEVKAVERSKAEKDAKRAAKRERKKAEKAARAAQRQSLKSSDILAADEVQAAGSPAPEKKRKKSEEDKKEKKKRKIQQQEGGD